MTPKMLFAIGYLCFISLLSAGFTLYDKIAAKKYPKKRVPENTLMYLGVLGGAVMMYIVMKLIRHKTLHKKFMIGLPVIFILQAVIIFIVYTSGFLGV